MRVRLQLLLCAGPAVFGLGSGFAEATLRRERGSINLEPLEEVAASESIAAAENAKKDNSKLSGASL